ncbi:hypothetical protein IFO70_10230 [Phormidium tenue FACHB-886]|nr:hypothetical protein [Phormidium tenue FACHB-886]
MQPNQPIYDFWSEPTDTQNGYQVPPNVVMNPPQGAIVPPSPAAAPAPRLEVQPRLMPPINPTLQQTRDRLAGLKPAPVRPWWFPLAMIGAPSVAFMVVGVTAVIASSGQNALVRSALEANSAVTMEGMRNRTDFSPVCVISCFGMDMGAAAQAATQAQPVQPIAPKYATAVAIDGVGLNVWNGERVVNTIPAGDKLKVIQVSGEWTLVEWVGAGGFQGWVKSQGVQN